MKTDFELLESADLLVRAGMSATLADAKKVLRLIPRRDWHMVINEAKSILSLIGEDYD